MTMRKTKTPQEHREDLCYEMFPSTRKLAVEVQWKLRDVVLDSTLFYHDLGSLIAKITRPDQEPAYGSRAVEHIASFVAIPGGTDFLYNLRCFAQEFTRYFVEQEASILLDNGRPFTLEHFLVLMKIKSKKMQAELIEQVRRECLTPGQLQREIDKRQIPVEWSGKRR